MLSNTNFTEAEIATDYGKFNFRVYADAPGKETVVLWTNNLDTTMPVLVRVHSECLTGDIFSSCRCDCGKQLQKSLALIQEQGGVLIYLRQEGRGIGLFEKIKTYQLQSQGHDTFDANVLLGHPPDARSYEFVKKILDDLGIEKIRLLTNNPSKVSEIAKSGVHVVERVALYVKPNQHNKRYIETKRFKFQHQFTKSSQPYFYQFHADNCEQLKEIGGFLKGKKQDPLLRICFGTDKPSAVLFQTSEEAGITPIFHVSFRNVTNVRSEIEKVREQHPYVKRIHMNDIKELTSEELKVTCDLFERVDLPLSDENFNIIHDKALRNLIKKRGVCVLLDNSKGCGIKESIACYKTKINTLLEYGINNIALCGGFGPDNLKDYFELRRFYKINFSIDAESQLKTSGIFDLQKIQLYLEQLTRFDDPKDSGVIQTRKILDRSRRSDWETTHIHGKEFMVHSQVFHPGIFPSSTWFATKLTEHITHPCDFCEVGCGSGVVSCFIALANSNNRITATDINPHASECTKLNAERLGVSDQVKICCGDVLDAIEQGKKFDYIFWLLPFGFLDPGAEPSFEELQVFDPGYRATRKFFQTAKQHLKEGGKILLGFSPDLGNEQLLNDLAKQNKIKLHRRHKTTLSETDEISFELIEGTYSN